MTPDKPSPEVFAALVREQTGLDVTRISSDRVGIDDDQSQLADDGSNQAAVKAARLVWVNGDEKYSTLRSLIGGTCYLLYCTNAVPSASGDAVTVKGVPSLPHVQWTVAADGALASFVGVSLDDKAGEVLASDYFGEGPCDGNPYDVTGTNPAAPTFREHKGKYDTALVSGKAFGANGTQNMRWPGVVDVGGLSLGDALVFRADRGVETFTVRNAGTVERTMGVWMDVASADKDKTPTFYYYDAAQTNGTNWVAFATSRGKPIELALAPGETATVSVGVDRPKAQGTATNEAVISVADLTGGSGMRVRFPVYVAPSTYYSSWPQGIWVGSAVLDRVTYGTSGEPLAAGGQVSAPVILQVDENSTATLLQRLVIKETKDKDGKAGVAYSVDDPGGDGAARRISCVLMDTAQPTVKNPTGKGFGESLEFKFTVGKESPVNPFRHSWHPDHDGLDADGAFAPDGDKFENYIGELKPELWSVSNTVSFAWTDAPNLDKTAPTTVSGELTWKLEGLRSDGPITCKGYFELQRITDKVMGDK